MNRQNSTKSNKTDANQRRKEVAKKSPMCAAQLHISTYLILWTAPSGRKTWVIYHGDSPKIHRLARFEPPDKRKPSFCGDEEKDIVRPKLAYSMTSYLIWRRNRLPTPDARDQGWNNIILYFTHSHHAHQFTIIESHTIPLISIIIRTIIFAVGWCLESS